MRHLSERKDTLPKILKYDAAKLGENAAIVQKRHGIWSPVSWNEYLNRVREIAYGLFALGLKRKEIVVIIGDNTSEWYFVELAVYSLGGITLGMSPESKPSKLLSLAKKFGVKFVFAQDQEQVDKILALKDDFPSIEKIVYWRYRGLGNYRDERLLGIRELVEVGRDKRTSDPDLIDNIIESTDPDDPCTIVFTSGTGGEPKGVLHSHRSIIENVKRYLEIEPWKKTDRIIPFFAPFGVAEKWLCIGCHLISTAVLYLAEDPRIYAEDMREARPTVVFLPGYAWEKMITRVEQRIRHSDTLKKFVYRSFMKKKKDEKKGLLSKAWELIGECVLYRPLRKNLGLVNARLCYNLGPLLNRKVLEFYHRIGVPLKNLYWTSETGFISVPREEGDAPECMGLPLRDLKVTLSERQEIVLSDGHSFTGYVHDEGKIEHGGTKRAFHTDDLGVIEPDGNILLTGRMEDFLISSDGKQISTQVLESLFRLSPGIKDAWVFGSDRDRSLSAFIIMDEENLRRMIGEKGIHYLDWSELVQKREVLELLSEHVKQINKVIPPECRIERYLPLPQSFWVEDETVSFTRKLRRGYFLNTYRDVIREVLNGKEKVRMIFPGDRGKEEKELPVVLL